MDLYLFPPSPNAIKVDALVRHLEIDVDRHIVDLSQGGQQDAAYRKLNPNAKMPTLVDGDFVLWESNAILQYLAAKSGSDLWPTEARAQAEVSRWQFWQSSHWGPTLGIFMFEHVSKKFFGGGDPDPAEIERGTQELARYAPVLQAQLEKHAYVAGDKLSVADFSVAAMLAYHEPAQLPLADYPAILKWYKSKVLSLPGWKAALPEQPPS